MKVFIDKFNSLTLGDFITNLRSLMNLKASEEDLLDVEVKISFETIEKEEKL